MKQIEIYTNVPCGYCARAKRLLDSKGLKYTEYDLSSDPDRLQELRGRTTLMTVPQIFIDGVGIGGWSELAQLDATGRLDELLRESDDGD